MKQSMRKSASAALRACFAAAVSAAVLLICSKNSPLYPMNDWGDVNCFFTVGRGITKGLLPYLDLYEQKGPLLYYVYALAALISESGFLGVFLIETALFSGFLFLGGRIAETLSHRPCAFWLAAAGLGLGVPLSPAFMHGGSAEEFFLPAFTGALYLVLKAMDERKPLTRGQGALLGALAAAALWIKYTFCGLFAGLALAVLAWYFMERRAKRLPNLILWALLGASAVSFAVLFWYLIRGALPALWNAYFVDNLTQYSHIFRGGDYDDPIPNLFNNLSWSIPMLLGLAGLLLRVKDRGRELLAVLLGGTALFIFTYVNGRKYPYYAMVMACLAPVGYGAAFSWIPAGLAQRKAFRRAAAILGAVIALASPFAARQWSANTYLMDYRKEDLPPYRFAEIIKQAEDTTLLNYGFLDGGFYLAAETLPVTRFFCTLNNNLAEMQEEFSAALSEGRTAFIVTRQDRLKGARNYLLIDKADMLFEGRTWTFSLYERVSDSP